VLSRSTGGDLHRSIRWREIYQPGGMGDELRVELAVDGRCWGTIEVVRERCGRLFSDEEADFALRLAPGWLCCCATRTWSAAGAGDSGSPIPGRACWSWTRPFPSPRSARTPNGE
jgi:hypothetical protein